MEPLLNNGICRCCASEGSFKDFLTSYHWMGEEEVYADMLKDCFSISVSTIHFLLFDSVIILIRFYSIYLECVTSIYLIDRVSARTPKNI